jgi:hypothetical protein
MPLTSQGLFGTRLSVLARVPPVLSPYHSLFTLSLNQTEADQPESSQQTEPACGPTVYEARLLCWEYQRAEKCKTTEK